MSRQRRWTCAVLLRGRLLEIEARERYVLSSLRAFNHPELRGVSSRVWRPSQTSNCWLNRKQQWSVFSGKRVDFYAPPSPAIGRLEAPLFCVYIRWGAERMRSLDLSGRHRRRHRRRRLLWHSVVKLLGGMVQLVVGPCRPSGTSATEEVRVRINLCQAAWQGLRCVVNVKLLGV